MTQSPKRTSRPINTSETPTKRSLPFAIWLIGGAAVVVVVLVVVLVWANRPTPVSAEAYADFPAGWVSTRSLGNPDAPVVIQAWEDFRCPACAQWTRAIEPQLIEEYITPEGEQGGQVRLEYHYFPLSSHGDTAFQSAQAAECAGDQNAFWPYHDRLFSATDGGAAAFTIDRLLLYAEELGLNTTTFSQCLVGQQYLRQVQQSANDAIAQGLNSTPSILINGQLIDSPFDYDVISAEIERLSAAAQ